MPTPDILDFMFDEWPVPRLIIEKDPDGFFYVARANLAAEKYFDQPAGALNGAWLDDLLDTANKHHIINAFGICFETGVAMNVQVVPLVPGGIRIQGFYLNPVHGPQKGPVIAIDMAGRLPASDGDALRRERDDAMSIFASVFEASDVGIVVTDHHGRIVRVNDTMCKTYGWEPIDLIGQEFTIMIPEDERQIAWDRHASFMGDTYTEKSRELKLQKKDGTLADVIASSGVIELSGARKFRISTVVDITNLKRVEHDLRRAKEAADTASKAKSSFLANMSHELRTPLNAIIGFSDMMETGTLGVIENAHYREYVSDIKFSASHLLAIINDVLDMSKIEAGHMKLDALQADIVTLLEDVTRLMRARAMENNITMELHISEQLVPVKVDARLIRQVLLNLLSNAVKFSHHGGKICICARSEDKWMVIDVRDEGIGIPGDKIDEVMRPFAQVLDPRIAKGQGTGLGLPIARAMVELHGGELSITSQLDKGTTVTCRLPVSA
jgi:PAS domain S-box-containing protein